MKIRAWKIKDGGRMTRCVLECGSPLPLSHPTTTRPPSPSAGGLAQSKTWRLVLTSFCFLLPVLCFRAWGQYSIDWFKIAGGGGTSTGGVYSVSGTIGQHDAGGPMTNGPYSLVGGFWALPTLVQTPGAPTLHLTNAAPGFATIWWSPPTPGFTLQSTDSLSPPTWVNAPTGPTNPATVPATLPTRFYRLFKP